MQFVLNQIAFLLALSHDLETILFSAAEKFLVQSLLICSLIPID